MSVDATVTQGERPVDGLSSWAQREFGEAELGDARLTRRLVQIMSNFYEKPMASIPQASHNWAGAKATYRFMDNEKVTPEAILAPHRCRTLERAAEHPVVLSLADTTMLDYTAHPETEGLGPLSDLEHRGLLVHPALMVTPAKVPLGVLDLNVWTRDEETFAARDASRPINEKESFKWLRSLDVAEEAQAELRKAGANTLVVSVFDREGDVYDVFAKASNMCSGLVVRSRFNRRVGEEDAELRRLWEAVKAEKPGAHLSLSLPRTPKRKAREADLEVRFRAVELRPPGHRRASEGFTPVPVYAVYASEVNAPKGATPVRWMILTTVAVESAADALRVLSWYTCRWSIELFFRVLKSGCEAEERQLETAERLKRCLAVDMAVAWRVLYLTTQGRETPDLPCDVVFEEDEWKALYIFKRGGEDEVPKTVPSLREVTRILGGLGGHLGRTGDGEPGQVTIWRGLVRLSDIAAMARIMKARGG